MLTQRLIFLTNQQPEQRQPFAIDEKEERIGNE
jgi:hypothetical protein